MGYKRECVGGRNTTPVKSTDRTENVVNTGYKLHTITVGAGEESTPSSPESIPCTVHVARFVSLYKAFSSANRTGSPQGFHKFKSYTSCVKKHFCDEEFEFRIHTVPRRIGR